MSIATWIDQDLCVGCGICEEKAPAVYAMLNDGLAYVKEGDTTFPGGPDALAKVPEELTDAVIVVAEECPGECIFIEIA